MFFLGVSAHLFIYLLVPAFLAICFYCRGIQGSPEVQAGFPEVRVYEHAITRYSADTYVYQADCRKKVCRKTGCHSFADVFSCVPEFFSPECIYTNPSVNLLVLRAPPVRRFFKGV